MDVNGCHIVSVLNADSPDGFASTVSRYVGFPKLIDVPADAEKVSKGPFYRQREAVVYAIAWKDASSPPKFAPHDQLDVNSCKLVTTESTTAPDGVETNVSKDIVTQVKQADGTMESSVQTIIRGPFDALNDAIIYAKSWTDPANPPELPAASKAGQTATPVTEDIEAK